MKNYDLGFVAGMIESKPIPLRELLNSKNSLSLSETVHRFNITPHREMGVYVIWWKDGLLKLPPSKELAVIGPIEKGAKEHPVYNLHWDKSDFPAICMEKNLFPLYIGKTTVFPSRLSKHLALGSKKGWLNRGNVEKNEKLKNQNLLIKHTTACQFRSGFEHLFGYEKSHNEMMALLKQVSVSFFPIHSEDELNRWDIKARFYLEDLAIGYYRPWFNVDSER